MLLLATRFGESRTIEYGGMNTVNVVITVLYFRGNCDNRIHPRTRPSRSSAAGTAILRGGSLISVNAYWQGSRRVGRFEILTTIQPGISNVFYSLDPVGIQM